VEPAPRATSAELSRPPGTITTRRPEPSEPDHQQRRHERSGLGSLSESELPINGYDELGVQDAVKQIKALDDSDDIRTIVRYEETHKARSGVVSAAQTRLATIAKEVAGVST
jgi:hypothetical protein